MSVDTSAYRRAVNVETRTFVRFTGDALPDEPAYAELPIGDPRSGLYTIEREGLREMLLPVPDLVDAATDAAEVAEAAAALAQDYAGTAVAASNVPIYPTRAFVTTFAVPVGINSFETKGYATVGDGGGARYSAGTPGPGGIMDGTSGTPRTFRLDYFQPVSLQMFGGNVTDLNSFVAAQLLTAKTYSPALHLARGLQWREFCKSTDPFAPQTAALQEAISAHIDSSRYYDLDLEGVQIVIEDTLQIDQALVTGGASKYPKTIRNGTITASGTAWGAKDQPILRLYHSGGGTIARWNFENVNFRGAAGDYGFSSGVFIDGVYNAIRFRRCEFINPALYAVRTRPNSAGQSGQNLRMEFCDVFAPHPSDMPFADRTCVAIDLWQDGDGKLFGNRIMQCRHALRGAIGSYLVQGNHFFQGRGGQTTPQSGYNPGIVLGVRPNSSFVNNYIDNGHVQFQEGLCDEAAAGEQGYCTFLGNRFTMANSAASENFITFRPTTSAATIGNLIIMGNEFRVIGSYAEQMTSPFRVLPFGGGSMQQINSRNNHIRENYWWGQVTSQSTHIEKRLATYANTTAYPIDVTGSTPFGFKAAQATRIAFTSTDTGSPGAIWFQRTEPYGTTGTLRLQTAQAGIVTYEICTNTRSEFE